MSPSRLHGHYSKSCTLFFHQVTHLWALIFILLGCSNASLKTVVTADEESGYETSDRQTCTYFYNERYPDADSGLVNCTWYASNACCKRTEVTSVFSTISPLYGASVQCKNYINYLMCFFCSPDQSKFYKSNKIMVCPDYCDSLYEECKTAGFNETVIGEAYTNGTAFCEAQNFHVVDNADCFEFDPNVFSHSSIHHMSWPLHLLFGGWIYFYRRCFFSAL